QGLIQKIYGENKQEEQNEQAFDEQMQILQIPEKKHEETHYPIVPEEDRYDYAEDIEEEEETASLREKGIELIKRSLERHNGKRKAAAKELGISEHTLYRKIKRYHL